MPSPAESFRITTLLVDLPAKIEDVLRLTTTTFCPAVVGGFGATKFAGAFSTRG
jgi:hypothetical protein